MTAVDHILVALARALEVERECGVRSIAIDRALLAPPAKAGEAAAVKAASAESAGAAVSAPAAAAKAERAESAAVSAESAGAVKELVFLHDGALTPASVTVMAKAILAMGRTSENSPIVVTGDLPKARIYVAMGSGALTRWFPELHGAPGVWLRSGAGDVLVTESPERFALYAPGSKALKDAKVRLWTALKGVVQRLNLK